MSAEFNLDVVAPLRERLNAHPVYAALQGLDDLAVFMQHHVHSVWDFMSMVKFVQHQIAPSTYPWTPVGDPAVRYFINSLVMEEESDEAPADAAGNPQYRSHFELYCEAMAEVGGDPRPMLAYVERVRSDGIEAALASDLGPEPGRNFNARTFEFIATGKPHVVCAALALGREKIIPDMFRTFLARMGVGEGEAPMFHYYLNRHIHLDEDFHGPLSMKLLEEFCAGDPQRVQEAEAAACQALEARIAFWDGVHVAIQARRAA